MSFPYWEALHEGSMSRNRSKSKVMTADEAVRRLKSGSTIMVDSCGGGINEPGGCWPPSNAGFWRRANHAI